MQMDNRDPLQQALVSLVEEDLSAALDAAQEALVQDPGSAHALFVIGFAAARMRRLGTAITLLDQAHQAAPDNREIVVLLAFCSAKAGRINDCLYYSKLAFASVSDPRLAAVMPSEYDDVATALQTMDVPQYMLDAKVALILEEWDRAEASSRQEIELNPTNAMAYRLLAEALAGKGALAGAKAALSAAVELDPRDAVGRAELAGLKARDGAHFEALEGFRAARGLAPRDGEVLARMATSLETFPDDFAAARAEAVHAFRAALPAPDEERPRAGGGKIRIGYLVNEHSAQAYKRMLPAVWEAHDPSRFDLYVFQQFVSSDLPLARHRARIANWREVPGHDDDTLACVIRGEEIDVLIDLCGVTPRNRAATLAQKPAPLQLGWLAPGADVLPEIYDAVLADEWSAVGDGVTYAKIAGGRFCFDPGIVGVSLAQVINAPATASGHATFGVRLEIADLIAGMRAWAGILDAVPGSVLYAGHVPQITDAAKERVFEVASQYGCAGRIRFQETPPNATHGETFWSNIDVLLEPPHANDPAFCAEALSMGVPVLTWRGTRHAHTAAASALGMVGFSQWCAESPEALPAIARALALDTDNLVAVRRDLVAAAGRSPLFDARRFTRALEAAVATLLGASA